MKGYDRLYILDMPVDRLTMDKAVSIISERIQAKRKTTVFTPNVDHLVKAQFDEEFKEIYSQTDLSLVDGMPLVWTSILYGRRLPQRINGTNLIWELCQLAQAKGFTLFFLGSSSDIVRLARQNLQTRFPAVKIAGYYSPPFGTTFDREEIPRIVEQVNSCKPDILLVAFGPLKQEKWINKYHKILDAYIFIGVGGALDLISGRLRRAPKWMQDVGLEWLFRLYQEPRRLMKRYLIGNAIFIYLVCKKALKIFSLR